MADKVRLTLGSRREGLRQVTIEADAGTVRLSGVVRSFFLRQMAFELASRVAGVLNVIDDLTVTIDPPHLPAEG